MYTYRLPLVVYESESKVSRFQEVQVFTDNFNEFLTPRRFLDSFIMIKRMYSWE